MLIDSLAKQKQVHPVNENSCHIDVRKIHPSPEPKHYIIRSTNRFEAIFNRDKGFERATNNEYFGHLSTIYLLTKHVNTNNDNGILHFVTNKLQTDMRQKALQRNSNDNESGKYGCKTVMTGTSMTNTRYEHEII